MTANFRIAHIPVEIEDQIISELEPLAAVTLRKINHFYHDSVSLQKRVKRVLRELEVTESNPQFACFTCLRLKPKDDFTIRHTKGKRGKHGTKWFERRCLSCCLEKQIFTPGSLVRTKNGQEIQAICRGCKSMKSEFCLECICCRECAEKRDIETVHAHEGSDRQVEESEFCGGAQRKHCWDYESLVLNSRWEIVCLYDYTPILEGSASPTHSGYSSLL